MVIIPVKSFLEYLIFQLRIAWNVEIGLNFSAVKKYSLSEGNYGPNAWSMIM